MTDHEITSESLLSDIENKFAEDLRKLTNLRSRVEEDEAQREARANAVQRVQLKFDIVRRDLGNVLAQPNPDPAERDALHAEADDLERRIGQARRELDLLPDGDQTELLRGGANKLAATLGGRISHHINEVNAEAGAEILDLLETAVRRFAGHKKTIRGVADALKQNHGIRFTNLKDKPKFRPLRSGHPLEDLVRAVDPPNVGWLDQEQENSGR